MKKIQNIEKIQIICSDWKPSDIAFVKSLNWSIRNLVMVFYCQSRERVSEWPDASEDFFEISMTFKNISSFKLDFHGAGLHQISGLDILDVSDDGLEKINFQIEDYENDSISFVCEEVEVTGISGPGGIVIDQAAD